MPKIEIQAINKSFKDGKAERNIIKSFSYAFPSNGLVCFLGESGSGKTTLLSMASSLLRPDNGQVLYDGVDIYSLPRSKMEELRAKEIGFVFQEGNLLEALTVLENLRLVNKDEEKIDHWLNSFGVLHLKNTIASRLSGGEKQRVAIARCMLKECSVVFLDEPTASLDANNSEEVIKTIVQASKRCLCIVSTHDQSLSRNWSDVTITLDGRGNYSINVKNAIATKPNEVETRAVSQKNRLDLFYGWKRLWARKVKPSILMAVSSISMLLMIGQGSLTFFDKENSIASSLNSDSKWFVPLEKTKNNLPTKEDFTIECGFPLYEEGKKCLPGVFPFIECTEQQKRLPVFLLPYQEGLRIAGQNISEPKEGKVTSAAFLRNSLSSAALKCTDTKYAKTFSFEIEDVVDFKYEPKIEYRDASYQNKHRDDFMNCLSFVILNRNDFYHLYRQNDTICFGGLSILADKLSTKEYTESFVTYGKKADVETSIGSSEISSHEVILSKKYIREVAYHSSLIADESSYENLIGKALSFRNLNAASNHVAFEMTPNVFSICESVVVKGITDDADADIFVSEKLYGDICDLLPYYSGGIATFNDNPYKVASALVKNDIKTSLKDASPIYQLESLKENEASVFLIVACLTLTFLTAAVGLILGVEGISGKEKNLALILSLGHSSKEAGRSYAFSSILFQLIAFAIGLLFSFVAIFFINQMLMAETVFDIAYPLLRVEPLGVLLTLIIGLLSATITTITSTSRLSRIDIADTFRGKA